MVFYAVLSVLFGFSFWVFRQTLDPRIPKWKLSESIIGTNPGKLLSNFKIIKGKESFVRNYGPLREYIREYQRVY